MQFRGPRRNIEWKSPLLQEGIKRPLGAGGNYENIAPQFHETKLLQRQRIAAELLLDERNSAPQFPGGDSI
jgi:hypothetical protein